jgi:hypothetical protein
MACIFLNKDFKMFKISWEFINTAYAGSCSTEVSFYDHPDRIRYLTVSLILFSSLAGLYFISRKNKGKRP